MYGYFKRIKSTDYILSLKCKGWSNEVIKPPSAPDNILHPTLYCIGTKTRVKFNGKLLKAS